MKSQLNPLISASLEYSLFTATIIVQKDKVRKDGNAPLVLLLTYERKRKKIALKLYWLPIFLTKGL